MSPPTQIKYDWLIHAKERIWILDFGVQNGEYNVALLHEAWRNKFFIADEIPKTISIFMPRDMTEWKTPQKAGSSA
jgi:hypothetical protein